MNSCTNIASSSYIICAEFHIINEMRFDVDYATTKLHRHQSWIFELPLTIKILIFGFQDQEACTLVDNEQRSVRSGYVSSRVVASVQDSTSITLQRKYFVIKVGYLNYLFLVI